MLCVYVCACVHACVCVYELFSFQVLQTDREEVQVQFLKKRGKNSSKIGCFSGSVKSYMQVLNLQRPWPILFQ